jgi:hypothetical protein
MVLAGATAIAGKVPGQRIATMTPRTSNSAAIGTTETVIDTVVAPVVAGRIYKVTWDGRVNASNAGNDYTASIREDSVSGTILQSVAQDIPIINRTPRERLEVEYEADATEDKTFVLTLDLVAGTGTVTGTGAATQKVNFYVDYIRDA